jgi:hypothetical protein
MPVKRRQCHFWLCDDDHRFLIALARGRDEPVGAVLRRMVRRLRLQAPGVLNAHAEGVETPVRHRNGEGESIHSQNTEGSRHR